MEDEPHIFCRMSLLCMRLLIKYAVSHKTVCFVNVGFLKHRFSFKIKFFVLFIHASADGHLSCFCFSAIMNNAAVTCVYVFLCGRMFSVFLGIYLEVELLGSVVTNLAPPTLPTLHPLVAQR